MMPSDGTDPYASSGSIQDYQNNEPPDAQAYAAQGMQVQQYQQYNSQPPSMLTTILPMLLGGGMTLGGGSGGFGGGFGGGMGGFSSGYAPGLRWLRLSDLSAADAEFRIRRVWHPLLIRPRVFDHTFRYLASLNRSPRNTWRTASLATMSRGLPSNRILPE